MNIQYTVSYSKRKTISIIVERDRSVKVRAPLNTSASTIDREIQKRKRLLHDKINHYQKYPSENSYKEFVSGESLIFLGKSYKLYLIDDNIDGVVYDSKFFINRKNQRNAKELFKEWYMKAAMEIIIPLAEKTAKEMGISYNSFRIRDLKYRWGSCTPKNNIHFNWKLIKAPISVIEYIIVHELTHLLEPDHTQEFWNRVSVQLPKYKAAKNWLKDYGHELEKDF